MVWLRKDLRNQTDNNWSDQGQIGWVHKWACSCWWENHFPRIFFHSIISNSPGYGGSGTRGSEFRFGFKDANWMPKKCRIPQWLIWGWCSFARGSQSANAHFTLGGNSSHSTVIAEDAILIKLPRLLRLLTRQQYVLVVPHKLPMTTLPLLLSNGLVTKR